jgi:CRISPR-associated protein Csm2
MSFEKGKQQRMNIMQPDLTKLQKILNGEAEELVKYASFLGERFAPQSDKERKVKLSSSQIRGILDDVQSMKKLNWQKLQLLRPKLAYITGKNKDSVSLKELQIILDNAIELVSGDEKKFENFKNFFEAIVGYHRFHSKVKEG